jgi:hypothetical protein
MADNKLDFSGATIGGPLDFSSSSSSGSALDWFQGFGKSAVSSIPELVGLSPLEGVEQFRQENPIAGFISEMAGTAVPYMGWFRAAKSIGPLARAAERLSQSKNAFLGGAGAAALTFAPFEAGRVAANELIGDQPLSNMLGSAATSLALSGGIGGLLHGIASGGTRDPKLPSMFPGIDVSLPLPLMARQMRELIDTGKITDPEMLKKAQNVLKRTLQDARTESPVRGQRYIGDIETAPDRDVSGLESQLNRLFKGTSEDKDPLEKTIRTRKFSQAPGKDFNTEFLWKNEAREAGLPEGFEEHGQYFRNITFNKYTTKAGLDVAEKQAKRQSGVINNILTKNMESVGGGNFLAREADDGLFVIARKYKGDVKKGSPDDRWVIFKTDKPGYFLPGPDKYSHLEMKLGSWLPNLTLAPEAGPVYNSLREYTTQFPYRNWQALQKEGKFGEMVNALLPKGAVGPSGEVVQRLGEIAREFLAPKPGQFRKAPRATWILNGAKVAFDTAETTVNKLINGELKVDPGKQLFTGALKGLPQGIDGLIPARKLINDAGLPTVHEFLEKVWRNGVPVSQLESMALKGEITPETEKLAKGLAAIEDWRNSTTQQVEVATGRPPTEYPLGQYGLPRTWEGDTRVIIANDSGNVVALAGGANRKLAQANAAKLVEANAEKGWHILDEVSQSKDPAGVAEWLGGKRLSLMEDQSKLGYMWNVDLPKNTDEFIKHFEGLTRRQMRYQANLSVGDILARDVSALSKEDPAALRMAKARLNDYAGVMSEFGKWQNQLADKVLAPMIGTDSASKIVAATNTAMFTFTLGAMKLAYPVVNALQFVQTVVPEAAFVLGKAVDESLAPGYSHFAAGGTKGPIGGLAVLNPIKMMARSVGEMVKPSRELSSAIERAVNERVLEPRVVEEHIGASGTKVANLRAVLKGEQGFLGWLQALSEFLPAETERISRTHAFTVGYGIARDFLKTKGESLNPEQLYRFAKEFTENTMYLYSTADRPRMFTTPAGSAMGLFKNWMFHYMASMAKYSGELSRGNFAPLLWQTAGTFGLGGLAATPAVGIANKFTEMWSDKSLMQLAYDHFDDNADWIMYGLPALLGLSMSGNVDTPALSNPVRDGSSLFSVASWGRAKALGDAAKAGFDHWQATGEHPGYDRRAREDLVKAFAPTTLQRSLSAFANPQAITSAGSGYPIVNDPSVSSRLLFAAGFNPTEIQRGYEMSKLLYDKHENLKAQELSLGKEWAEAEIDGNSAKMATIMRQGMTWGVDMSRVIKNGMREISNFRKDIMERSLRPKEMGAWRKVMLGGEEE